MQAITSGLLLKSVDNTAFPLSFFLYLTRQLLDQNSMDFLLVAARAPKRWSRDPVHNWQWVGHIFGKAGVSEGKTAVSTWSVAAITYHLTH